MRVHPFEGAAITDSFATSAGVVNGELPVHCHGRFSRLFIAARDCGKNAQRLVQEMHVVETTAAPMHIDGLSNIMAR